MNSANEISIALKTILNRLKESKPSKIIEINESNCSHDCTNCKYHTREEGYDQEWGMFKFMFFYCDKGHNVMFHVKSDCSDFEYGENKIIYMTKEKKQNLDDTYYYDWRENLVDDFLYNKITLEETLRNFGVDVKTKDGNYRNMCDVLQDISKKWIE